MNELKPCPFCGSDPELVTGAPEYSVRCNACGAGGDTTSSSLKAIERWNRRAMPEGIALVPREITAETGHKAGMMGEFFQPLSVMCEACDGDGEDENDESGLCSDCAGTGEQVRKVNVSWTNIKAIHRRMIEIAEAGAE